MANALFPNFSRAQEESLRRLRQSALGRVVADAAESLRTGRSPRDTARQISRALGRRGYVNEPTLGRDFRPVAQRRAESQMFDDVTRQMNAALGATLGSVMDVMVRPQGVPVGNATIEAELAIYAALLAAFGPNVAELAPMPERSTPAERPEWMRPREAPRETDYDYRREHSGQVPFGSPTQGYPENDPVMTGEMVMVRSSNVHSIGYRWNRQEPGKGTLIVRFLEGSGEDRQKTEAGPTYAYYDVHPQVFQAFRQAASKGKFVWDRLRIRGSVTGHQFAYKLIGLGRTGYVPRQATRYGQNEYFLRRQVRGANGGMYSSRRDDQRVGPRRGRVQGRASAYGTAPNRGTPNRGR